MRPPFQISELDALLNACIHLSTEHFVDFYAGQIAGQESVTTDLATVQKMLAWVARTDRNLLDDRGLDGENVRYYRVGYNAADLMQTGGFHRYFRRRKINAVLTGFRQWIPIAISSIALVVAYLAWRAPNNDGDRISKLSGQIESVQLDQGATKRSIMELRQDVETLSAQMPSSSSGTNEPTGGNATKSPHVISAPDARRNVPPTGDIKGGTVTGSATIVSETDGGNMPDDRPRATNHGNHPSNGAGTLNQPWLLLASISIFAISLFLFFRANEFQKWVSGDDKLAPDPSAGDFLAIALSAGMFIFTFFYWLVSHRPQAQILSGGLDTFAWFVSNRPSEIAVGPLLASLAPATMALFKFVMASFLIKNLGEKVPVAARSPAAAVAGATFSVISLIASIATLITFFFWLKGS